MADVKKILEKNLTFHSVRHGVHVYTITGFDVIAKEICQLKDTENKELGLLLESRVGGLDEFCDWSKLGMRTFREQVLLLIKEHCKELKAGGLGILGDGEYRR